MAFIDVELPLFSNPWVCLALMQNVLQGPVFYLAPNLMWKQRLPMDEQKKVHLLSELYNTIWPTSSSFIVDGATLLEHQALSAKGQALEELFFKMAEDPRLFLMIRDGHSRAMTKTPWKAYARWHYHAFEVSNPPRKIIYYPGDYGLRVLRKVQKESPQKNSKDKIYRHFMLDRPHDPALWAQKVGLGARGQGGWDLHTAWLFPSPRWDFTLRSCIKVQMIEKCMQYKKGICRLNFKV